MSKLSDNEATTLIGAGDPTPADELRAILERNEAVYAIVKHVSRSGMQRRIEFYVIDGGAWSEPDEEMSATNRWVPEMRRISHLVAKVLGRRFTDEGVICNGAGMDMGWDAIYSVRRMLGLGEVQMSDDKLERTGFSPGYGFTIRYL